MRVPKTLKARTLMLFAVAFVAISFIQLQTISAKNPVTRPFQIKAQFTILDAAGEYPMTILDRGEASALGSFVNVGKYAINPDTGVVIGIGIVHAANGDQIFWRHMEGSNVVEFTGGTGRFQEVSGGFAFTMSDPTFELGPEGTMTMIFAYQGEGTITY